jgi:hypothetical protein
MDEIRCGIKRRSLANFKGISWFCNIPFIILKIIKSAMSQEIKKGGP